MAAPYFSINWQHNMTINQCHAERFAVLLTAAPSAYQTCMDAHLTFPLFRGRYIHYYVTTK
ncbi:hypothetical protein [Corallincola holothuriorum]|uniref:hypothetical protein n=1 Tax=Corallincola holothuriorum TaxID=2282215 RepID=UPI0011C06583|nr:hypothetical protein [Corallincola holothuriorum]